jgi:uncharacterized membrane protein YjjB (DUF3815 family)
LADLLPNLLFYSVSFILIAPSSTVFWQPWPTIYLVVSLIPLVPGASVYYTMLNFLQGDIQAGIETGLYTLAVSGALSMGIIIVSSTSKLIHRIKENRKGLPY